LIEYAIPKTIPITRGTKLAFTRPVNTMQQVPSLDRHKQHNIALFQRCARAGFQDYMILSMS
jgi:hypothetical protein